MQQQQNSTTDLVSPWALRAALGAAIADCVTRDGNVFQPGQPLLDAMLDVSPHAKP